MRNVNLNILKFLESIDNFCLSLINRGRRQEATGKRQQARGNRHSCKRQNLAILLPKKKVRN
ncbi:MAG: hypothetical protein EWV63_21005 [Microcystis aeruginosa Ma_OC_H_19870700_S124]|uniref:Uncharacterized protein n=1 Tax=Microcystis aeruginosa Ma_OC_H_19870700_S124 TaxID=2486262 RepID=A0A552A8W2_MICAE|nr:MAG: hypothetical protein EWV63_21005 [Microcystis aeruginosa Ma_OC_H_19870700_S124]